ncbi:TetR/AcrR family transcriptional regulator [Chitinophaga polysaccharea]|uniref:TetR/AcrR family transcriptional regulator n=1 Tax=Chitinophaga TaxID=79328 RepID=UPI001455C8C9|nr:MULTISPECIES: TetR/AcrR family transcriptional regulator [Chitinophaga]NLR62549.1 TetR/AcrR family transcriptional regulator [Chitinophaga polysaccharea]NLU91517.1 TetR/AcrR family transcriptional regulator [Chitinophaga sp. Ak27]
MNKAEKTRQFIVEKTAPVFNEKGYVGTSLNDMTNATGLTKGSIYGNFANKDEVALAAFDHNLKQVTTIIQQEMSKHNTCREKLMVYVQVYSNFQKHPFPEGGCPLLNTATEADDTHAALRQRAADGIQRWKNAITGLIEKGIQLGEFRKDVPVEQTALSMIATIEGCIMMTKLTGKTHYQKAIMRTVEKLIDDL